MKRSLVAVALALAACSRTDHRPSQKNPQQAPSASAQRGPDALILRVPRRGGPARVVAYENVDSVVWTASEPSPALDHVLAFDDDGGIIAYVDTRGLPGWIDLRLGTDSVPTRSKLFGLTSIDGVNIYGVRADGAVVRLAPAGEWVFKPPRPARSVFPQSDGALLVLAGRGASSMLWRLHPPDAKITDAVPLPAVSRVIGTQLGDRLYFVSTREGVVGVRTRTLAKGASISLRNDVVAIAATPSGDRLFLASDSTRALSIVDRYRDRITSTIELPGEPRDLRVDPLGRYLLVRSASGDSAWVVAVGTDRVIGSVRTTWRSDLPLVAPDGSIVLAQGKNVVAVDGETLQPRRSVPNGADDFWYAFLWNGFRPRASALDRPVRFATDSADTTRPPAQTVDTAPPRGPPPPDTAASHGFTVSFATLLSEQRARDLASEIRVRGQPARVVQSAPTGETIYRVVLGPYATRDDAERAGRESGRSYWVFEGAP